VILPIDIAKNFGTLHREADFDGHKYPVDKGWLCVDGYSCEVEAGDFLWGLTRYLKPDVVVETGTYHAFATACIALALRENNMGHVWTIEIESGHEIHNQRRMVELGLDSWVTLVSGDSLSDDLARLLPGMIDILFVDGGNRAKEHDKYAPLVSHTGIIMQHDALKHKYVYDHQQSLGAGFVWGIRGISMILPKG